MDTCPPAQSGLPPCFCIEWELFPFIRILTSNTWKIEKVFSGSWMVEAWIRGPSSLEGWDLYNCSQLKKMCLSISVDILWVHALCFRSGSVRRNEGPQSLNPSPDTSKILCPKSPGMHILMHIKHLGIVQLPFFFTNGGYINTVVCAMLLFLDIYLYYLYIFCCLIHLLDIRMTSLIMPAWCTSILPLAPWFRNWVAPSSCA